MMNSYISLEELVDLFATHPKADILFITADGQAFFDLESAGSHAQRQRDKNVVQVHRDDLDGDSVVDFVDGIDEAPLRPSNTLIGSLDEFSANEGGNQKQDKGLNVEPKDILADDNTAGGPYVSPELQQILDAVKAKHFDADGNRLANPAPAAPVIPANTDIVITDIKEPVSPEVPAPAVTDPEPAKAAVVEPATEKKADAPVVKPAEVKKAAPVKKPAAKKTVAKPVAKPAAKPAVKQILTPNN